MVISWPAFVADLHSFAHVELQWKEDVCIKYDVASDN